MSPLPEPPRQFESQLAPRHQTLKRHDPDRGFVEGVTGYVHGRIPVFHHAACRSSRADGALYLSRLTRRA
jgi:hypothetical protein